jgi:acetolactate synthase-1/3 small subunit
MRHTLSVLVENQFGVLTRVTGMFSGRGFNIDTLNVGPTQDPELSRITATVQGDNEQLDQCIKQLQKLVNVIEVIDLRVGQFVARELIMLKVSANSETRGELVQICDIFRAKIIDVRRDRIIVEMTGDESKVRAFLELIEPFGLLELARTGNVALKRRIAKEESEEN